MVKSKPMVVKFITREPYLYTYLGLAVEGNFVWFISRVDLRRIERNLRAGNTGVEGFFGSIFKGIKKAVSVVGKATGLNKVVKIAGKVLGNPVLKAIIPGAAQVSAAAKVASNLVTATVASKAKHPAAPKALAMAYAEAKRANLDPVAVTRTAAKIYKVVVTPEK